MGSIVTSLIVIQNKKLFTRNEIQPVILTYKKMGLMATNGMFTLKTFQSIVQVEWVVNPFAPKFCSLQKVVSG